MFSWSLLKKLKSILLTLVCVLTVASVLLPLEAYAQDNVRVVKVGFFAFDGYHEIDKNGRRSGYGYDFLTKMKRYADVKFEYVGYDKNWNEMQQMLLNGEIDMVTSAHITEERLKKFDFSQPIGENSIILNVRADNNDYLPGVYATYNGMVIGLVEGSSINAAVANFAAKNNFSFTTKYYANANQLKAALHNREINAIATSSLRKYDNEKVLSEFNHEKFYAMVRKGDSELLKLIDHAIMQMDIGEGNWQHNLYYDNYKSHNYSGQFTQEEKDYIAAHSRGGKKVIFAADNAWAPFVSKAKGQYVGIIPDYVKRGM